jgi:hypothetical protein
MGPLALGEMSLASPMGMDWNTGSSRRYMLPLASRVVSALAKFDEAKFTRTRSAESAVPLTCKAVRKSIPMICFP